jgi:O-antigen ligase
MNSISKLGIPLIFLPFFLISGPLLSDLTITLSSVFFLTVAIYYKKLNYFNNKYFIFFFCYWIFISLNSFLSENFSSIKASITFLRFGIFIILISYLFNLNNNFSNNFRKIILVSIIILFIDSFIQYFFGKNIIGISGSSRISSFFGEEKIMGSYIIKILPIYISLYFLQKKIKINFHIILVLFICALLILLSGERSALGLFVLYLFLISLIFFDNLKFMMIFLTAFLFFFILVFSNSESAKNRFINQFINEIQVKNKTQNANQELLKLEKNNKYYIFTRAHDSLIQSSLKMFKDKPIIGHGTKMFRYKCIDKKYSDYTYKYSCNTHPHNYYFQMLAENGLVGFFFLFFLFVYFCFNFFKNLFNNNKNKLLCLFLVPNIVNLWPIVPHGNFFNNWISITIFLSLGFYISFIQSKMFNKYNINKVNE